MSRGGRGGGRAGQWPEVVSAGSSQPPGCCTTWPCLSTPEPAAGCLKSSDPWPTKTHTHILKMMPYIH